METLLADSPLAGTFLARLLLPSPIMRWLLLLLPLTITLSGVLGAAERHSGTRHVALAGAAVLIWLFLPWIPRDPMLLRLSIMGSALLWCGLVWARLVWNHWPSPVWAHGVVVSHLMAILVAAGVALVRAL